VTATLRARRSRGTRHAPGREIERVAAGTGIVVVNGALIATAARGWILVLCALALVVPVAAAVADRPQRGLLTSAALAPLEGLLLLFPSLK
jgi:hypothetical protein